LFFQNRQQKELSRDLLPQPDDAPQFCIRQKAVYTIAVGNISDIACPKLIKLHNIAPFISGMPFAGVAGDS